MNDLPITPSDRMNQLPEYLFGRLNAEKQRRRSQGIDIIDFGMGNRTMPPSLEPVRKITDLAGEGRWTRYRRAPGLPHFRKAVANHYRRLSTESLGPGDEVLLT